RAATSGSSSAPTPCVSRSHGQGGGMAQGLRNRLASLRSGRRAIGPEGERGRKGRKADPPPRAECSGPPRPALAPGPPAAVLRSRLARLAAGLGLFLFVILARLFQVQ